MYELYFYTDNIKINIWQLLNMYITCNCIGSDQVDDTKFNAKHSQIVICAFIRCSIKDHSESTQVFIPVKKVTVGCFPIELKILNGLVNASASCCRKQNFKKEHSRKIFCFKRIVAKFKFNQRHVILIHVHIKYVRSVPMKFMQNYDNVI